MRVRGFFYALAASLLLIGSNVWAEGPTVGSACRLIFTPSASSDVAAYDIFVGTVSGSYGPAQRVPLSSFTPASPPDPSTDLSWGLCVGANLTASSAIQYYVTAAAVDSANNSSVLAVEAPFVLDPQPPAAASNLRVR